MNNRCWAMTIIVLSLGCGQGESTLPIAFNPTGAAVVEFSLPDMMCAEGCGTKVNEILSEQQGVKDVVVDFETKSATVAIEEGKFDSAAALAALVDHGFDKSSLKDTAVETAEPQAANAK